MAGRDTRSPDPDDWFADPDRAPSRRARSAAAAAARVAADEDDWVGGARRPRRQAPNFAANLPDRWLPIAAGAVLVLILLVGGLAIAGVFSSSKATPTAITTQFTSTPTTTPTTTPAVTTVPAPATALTPGDTGAQVKVLQRALAQLGYTVGTVDGDYGTATKTAVAQFQTAQKLTADGVFGPATRAALIKALSRG
jgi:murein L,D-transpeptidase YcbB/YkuD